MATAAIFSSLRRLRSPSPEAFLAPIDLSDSALVQTLAAVSSELISSYSRASFPFQHKNIRDLIRKIEVFVMLFDFIIDSGKGLPSTAVLCFKELYLILYRSKMLLDYCSQSSRVWFLLQNNSMSGHFHDINQDISTLLDVFPFAEFYFGDDITEQIELVQRQSRRARLYVDRRDEGLRQNLFRFLEELENGWIPNFNSLKSFFIEGLGIRDPNSLRSEVEFLEEQICNQEGDLEPTASVINGFVALARYCRFLLFGFDEDEFEVESGRIRRGLRKSLITREIADTFVTVPKDFCCPISLDLMRDPVIVSTGQTYDRSSISRWMEDGHCTCPKTGQFLNHTRLVPNHALRNLISQFCSAHGAHFELSDFSEPHASSHHAKSAVVANRLTVALLIERLEAGNERAKAIAAREIRLMAKSGRDSRAYIAESGAIPRLKRLLGSSNPIAQENSVTAMLNLSIHEANKKRIIDEDGCLDLIVEVLRLGATTESRENAAATLFSLSAVHDYKRRIASARGAVEALSGMLDDGTARGRKDAVTALFNLSTHASNCSIMVETGAVAALVRALETDGVMEEAAGALALIVRHPEGAKAVARVDSAVAGLVGMMRCGTARGKENAVAALLELCRSGGGDMTERVVKAPSIGGLIQTLLFTGTKRARRKAASLARVFQRCESASALQYAGLGAGFNLTRGNSNGSGFDGDVSVVPLSISVL